MTALAMLAAGASAATAALGVLITQLWKPRELTSEL